MAFTTSDLDAINAAIASGELTVEYEGKKVTYRSMNELLSARTVIREELVASGLLASSRITRSVAAFSKD